MARRSEREARRRTPAPVPTPADAPGLFDPADAAWLGERLRRLALGLTAALIMARAFWPSEGVREAETAGGLGWILTLLVTAALACLASWVGGRARVRFSWADAAVVALMLLVGLSAAGALDRRPAINLAWEWAALGVAYVLVRNLPRTRGESVTLAGALAATAVAISAYGVLYQVPVEYPETRAMYLKDPERALRLAGIASDPVSRAMFEDRLLGSNEPTGTFALANSLAGFLLGPTVLALAVGLESLRRRDDGGPRSRGPGVVPLVLGLWPALLLLACLLLTKSRSAYLGLAVGVLALAWRGRGQVPSRAIIGAGAGLLVLLGLLVGVGLATGGLDRQVLTESTKSLRYRWEYWQGTWGVIRHTPRAWWHGVGPGNFGRNYLRYKLPGSSEEIADPHNLVLEAWATAGLPAVLALLAALAFALRDLFGPGREEPSAIAGGAEEGPGRAETPDRSGWLLACAGGGWVLPVALGRINPFLDDDLTRWLILGGAWAWAVLFGAPLWRRRPVPAAGLGAAALAVAVNLLAAGGIGIPTVALGLWTVTALGLNLRDDRPCGRLRDAGGRATAFALAAVVAALVGTFYGSILPFWNAEAAMAEAHDALAARPQDVERALEAYRRAIEADAYSARPWLALADLEFRAWMARGTQVGDPVWLRIDHDLEQALKRPRNPYSLEVQRLRAFYAREILGLNLALSPLAAELLRNQEMDALGKASWLYPTNASLHAELAGALADRGHVPLAVKEAEEALRLDRLTPHADKKLPAKLREQLLGDLARWKAEPSSEATQKKDGPGS
jgi:tetratricopeptide (TPR) repeat protein